MHPNHEPDLLQKIIMNPDDDKLRLDYADSLGENDPQARLIRLQIEMSCKALLFQGRFPRDPDWEKFLEKERSLLSTFKKNIVASPLQPFLGYQPDHVVDRGFIDSLRIPVDTFLDSTIDIVKLFEYAPLTYVDFLGVTDSSMKALASSSKLEELPGIAFNRQSMITRSQLQVLLASPHLSRLRRLYLIWTNLGTRTLQDVVSSPVLEQLDEFSLGLNKIGSDGVRSLAGSSKSLRLNRLELSENPIGDRGAYFLARSDHFTNLQALDLVTSDITDEGADALLNSSALSNTLIRLEQNDRITPPMQENIRREMRRRFQRVTGQDPELNMNLLR